MFTAWHGSASLKAGLISPSSLLLALVGSMLEGYPLSSLLGVLHCWGSLVLVCDQEVLEGGIFRRLVSWAPTLGEKLLLRILDTA